MRSMNSYAKPTPSLIDRAVALLASPQLYRIFFGRLENPEWVAPLREQGYFAVPPKPIEAKDGVAHPAWPASEYLVRMAPAVPEEVFKALEDVETANSRVISNIAEAALSMPGRQAAKLSEKVLKAIRDKVWVQVYGEHATNLVVTLAEKGETAAAISMADALFALRAKESAVRAPIGIIASHDFCESLPRVTLALGKADAERGMKWTCGLLEKAASFHRSHGSENEFEDFSYVWRSTVEGQPQRFGDDIEDATVCAVRDLAEYVVREKRWSLGRTVDYLDGYQKLIFSRIAMHIVRLFAEQDPNLARARMLRKGYFDEHHFKHEYAMLLRDRFSMLQSQEQETILAWIDSGPDREEIREFVKMYSGQEFSESEVERRVRIWQRDRLSWFSGSLPGEWRKRYADLVDELGEPRHADLSHWTEIGAGWGGPEPPKNAAQLAEMDTGSLVKFLQTWRPDPSQSFEPSLHGLATEFAAAVRDNLDRFAAEAPVFGVLHPTYVSSLLREVSTAVQNDRKLPAEPVIDLCLAVVSKPVQLDATERIGGDELDSDPSWEYARNEVARVIELFCDRGVDFSLRERIWNCLAPLESSEDQSYIEDEPKEDIRLVTWLDRACNNPRACWIGTVIRYAVWVKSQTVEASGEKEADIPGMTKAPEAAEVLERHLGGGDSPAVRSEYGTAYVPLCWLDLGWASAQAAKIFTLDGNTRSHGWAAWNSYLATNRAYDAVFVILRKTYEQAVSLVQPSLADDASRFHPLRHLAEHLVFMYGRGVLYEGDHEGLLHSFLRNASTSIRSHAIQTVGRSLEGPGERIPAAVIERFVSLWEWYWSTFVSSEERSKTEQYADFGWWFVCGKFDVGWCFDRLEEVLQVAPMIEPEREVMKRLSEMSAAYPLKVIACVDKMVRGDKDGWRMYGWEKDLPPLLGQILQNKDAETRVIAVKLIENLGRRGYLRYGDLLSQLPK